MTELSLLSQCNLFATLTVAEIEQVFSQIKVKESCFAKGDILAMQGELCNRLIFLLSGSVKAEMSDPAGRVVKVEDIHAPNPLAILFLFGKENRFPVQVTANEEVKALIIPHQSVLRMLMLSEKLLKNYLDISANFAARLSRKLHFMSFRTIRQKLAMYLLEQSKAQQTDIVLLDRPKSILADYFGVSRPSLERELSRMHRDGLILSERKKITIEKKEELVKMIEFAI